MKKLRIITNRAEYLEYAKYTVALLKSLREDRSNSISMMCLIVNDEGNTATKRTECLQRLQNIIKIRDLILVENQTITIMLVADHDSILNVCTRVMSLYEHAEVGAVAGIASYPEDGRHVGTLMDKAYLKASNIIDDLHKNKIAFNNPKLQFKAQNKIKMNTQIIRALNNRDFGFLYQPKIDINGKVVGAEALIRWFNFEGKAPSPADFIPIAETTGIIIQIGEYAFQHNASQMQHWADRGVIVPLSINVSSRQIEHKHYDFVSFANDISKKYDFPKGAIELEITETAILHDSARSREIIEDLRGVGYKIVLDDFGVGHSTLSHLLLPIDAVKIDKKFVDGMLTQKSDAAVVRAIISVAKDLGVSITAEGVESKEQAQKLFEMGCDNLQGYYFAKPLPASEYTSLIKNGSDITTMGKPILTDFEPVPQTPIFLEYENGH